MKSTFKCLFCGLINSSEAAKFCTECGPTSPAKDWALEDIDQESKVNQYVSMLAEFYFDAQNPLEVEKRSLKMRERLRISHATHTEILTKLEAQKKSIAHLSNFQLEFNENVIDAFAGHDTFLDFRFTNLSENDSLKVSLIWDDLETTDRLDFRAETKKPVNPLETVTIGSKAIFDRIGIKEISDLQLTISDQFGESANFRAEPFRFRVGNHNQKISTTITTNQHISIEGRGVVDASGVAGNLEKQSSAINNQPIWRGLKLFYIPSLENFRIQESNKTTSLEKISNKVSALNSTAPVISQEVVPDIGDFDEVVVVEILVNIGDTVQAEQSLITVESDKASMEIPSSKAGVVKEIHLKLGDRVKQGSALLTLYATQAPNGKATFIEVKVPELTESETVGLLLDWKKSIGEYVNVDEILVEIELDKVVLEVPSPAVGLFHHIFCLAGSTVKSGEIIALISTDIPPTKSQDRNHRHQSVTEVKNSVTKGIGRVDGIRSHAGNRNLYAHILTEHYYSKTQNVRKKNIQLGSTAKKYKNLIAALDIGTAKVMSVIAEVLPDGQLQLAGMGLAPSNGLNRGVVGNIDAVLKNIQQALKEAEHMADCKITHVYTGITGGHIAGLSSTGMVAVSKNEVIDQDVFRVFETAKAIHISTDQRLLLVQPQKFVIDGQEVGEPVGMSGTRLEASVHIVTTAQSAAENVIKCVRRCGLEVAQLMLNPMASSLSVLTDDERELGVVLVDIGAGTTDVVIFTNGSIRHTAVISIAGDLITSDIAMALRTPSKDAEKIKIESGFAKQNLADPEIQVEVPGLSDGNARMFSQQALASVIEPRVEEIFSEIQKVVRESGYEDVLSAGIVLTGGSAVMPGMVELAEDIFLMPVRRGIPNYNGNLANMVSQGGASTAMGLLEEARFSLTQGNEISTKSKGGFWSFIAG